MNTIKASLFATLILIASSLISVHVEAASVACTNLSYGLRYGASDSNTDGEVSALQEYLASQGFLDSEPTGYFGGLTLRAVKSLQSSVGIESTGFVGPLTRAKIRELSCGNQGTTYVPIAPTINTPINTGTVYSGNVNFGNNQYSQPIPVVVTVCAPGAMFNIVTGAPCPANPLYYPPVAERPNSFTILAPNGGESFTQGSNMDIRWNTRQTSPTAGLELRRDTVSSPTIISSAVDNTGSVVWKIPANQPVASDYRLYIYDANNRAVHDESNSTFSIIQSPYTAKSITSFNFTSPAVTGMINEEAKTITLNLPFGTTNRSFAPVIAVTPNATISPASGVVQNFSTYKDYVVKAQDGSVQTYRVTVSVDNGSSAKSITSFNFSNSQISTSVDQSNRVITINVPYGFSVASLAPTIGVSTGATISPASGVAQNFSSSRTYTVKAQDGSAQTYTTNLVVGPKSDANQITSFSIPSIPTSNVSIDQSTRIITVSVPHGTDMTSRIPSIVVSSNATVAPASGVARNFSSPVDYVVTSQSGVGRTYSVRVSQANASSDNVISSFSLNGVTGTTTIDNTANLITVRVPYGTTLSRTTTITLSSPYAKVSPAQTVARTFTVAEPLLTYDVTAQNGDKRTYKVKIIPESAATGCAITSVSFLGVSSTLEWGDENVIATLPYGTNILNLRPIIGVSTGASLVVGDPPGTSVTPGVAMGATSFASPVKFTVRSQSGTCGKIYRISATTARPSTASAITSVRFVGISNSSFVIDNTQHIVTVTVPNGTSRNSLTPIIEVSPFASISSTPTPPNQARSFTDETHGVSYKIVAQDTDYSTTYSIKVLVAR